MALGRGLAHPDDDFRTGLIVIGIILVAIPVLRIAYVVFQEVAGGRAVKRYARRFEQKKEVKGYARLD